MYIIYMLNVLHASAQYKNNALAHTHTHTVVECSLFGFFGFRATNNIIIWNKNRSVRLVVLYLLKRKYTYNHLYELKLHIRGHFSVGLHRND